MNHRISALALVIVLVVSFSIAPAQTPRAALLEVSPTAFLYPFNTQPLAPTPTQSITVTNVGDVSTEVSVSVTYYSGALWLDLVSSPTFTIPPGEENSANVDFIATGPVSEGLYQAELQLTYDDGALRSPVVVDIPIDLYCFSTFCLPENQEVRTGQIRLGVNAASEIAAGDVAGGNAYTYFSDGASYLSEGYLVIGNSATNLSYSTFKEGLTPDPQLLAESDNPYGYLYAKDCDMLVDSTAFVAYRIASGKGVNRDSTIEYSCTYYAPKFPGDNNAEFFVLKFELYAGENFSADITGLNIGYFVDWDVPDATGNVSEFSGSPLALVFQGGDTDPQRWAAVSVFPRNDVPLAGKVFENDTYIYPDGTWENDSLWNWLSSSGPLPDYSYEASDPDSIEDLSALFVGYRDVTLTASDTLPLYVFLASEDSDASGGLSSVDLLETLELAYFFACDHELAPECVLCEPECFCGDCNNDGVISIADAACLVQVIFGGQEIPNPPCLGDADGSSSISIGDAVYIINYIFGGGPAPHCP